MIPKFNLHTHTVFGDGKNTVEEMVLAAIDLGCDGIGFSEHSFIEDQTDWTMEKTQSEDYISEVLRAKEKYKDRIEILLGIEYDTLSSIDLSPFDYVIGSVHFVVKDGCPIPVDNTADALTCEIKRLYGGDFYSFCEDYYRELALVKEKTSCDIVGHFDLVTKFNENGALFDESDRRYRDAAFGCLDVLAKKDLIFEINTGAISRGYRKKPYPSEVILRRMAELGCKVTVTTDCHSADSILCHYNVAIELAKECGIRELYLPKEGKLIPYKL